MTRAEWMFLAAVSVATCTNPVSDACGCGLLLPVETCPSCSESFTACGCNPAGNCGDGAGGAFKKASCHINTWGWVAGSNDDPTICATEKPCKTVYSCTPEYPGVACGPGNPCDQSFVTSHAFKYYQYNAGCIILAP